MKWWVVPSLVVFAFAGCVEDDAEPDSTMHTMGSMGNMDHDGMDMGGNGSMVEMYTVATDFSSQADTIYRFRPASFEAKVGDTLNVTIKGAVGNQNPHDLVIDELSFQLGPVNSGEFVSDNVVASKAGTFAFYCSITNHRQLGMEGTLTIS